MNKLILIAEDNDNTSSLLMRYLTKEGFDPVRADNGDDALQIAQSRRPCLVILDLMMPGLDGWEVCRELRATTEIAILILSARQEEADRILGLNLGADDYVVKPFSPREVVARVHAILRRSVSTTGAKDEIVEGLRDQVIAPNEHHLRVLEKESMRLGDLVESLLDLSRADAARYTLSCERFYVQQAVATAIDRHAESFRQKQLATAVYMPEDLQPVVADKDKVQIVLGILLQNACQYAPMGSEIAIFSKQEEDEIILSMSNCSETIPDADLPFIFERFYRADKSRSRHSGGAGIGLAIVKRMVEAHGGIVSATSSDGLFTISIAIPNRRPVTDS